MSAIIGGWDGSDGGKWMSGGRMSDSDPLCVGAGNSIFNKMLGFYLFFDIDMDRVPQVHTANPLPFACMPIQIALEFFFQILFFEGIRYCVKSHTST